MIKKILAVILLLPILGISYELTFSKDFERKVSPDLLSTSISISIEKKDEKSVNIEVEKFNKFINNTKNITIKNTNYSLSPRYKYINNEKVFKGYLGNTSFVIETKEANRINDFLGELIKLKDNIKSKDIKLNIDNLYWKVSKVLQNKSIEELRLEALIWIDKYSKALSNEISRKCEIKNIKSFIKDNYANNYSTKMMLSASSVASNSEENTSNDIITPINTQKTILLEVTYGLDCK